MNIEKHLGYIFKNKKLLEQALTPPILQKRKLALAYERLEFLGDRVLNLVIAEALYSYFSHSTEGDLAKRYSYLTSRQFCHRIAEELKLQDFIKTPPCELEGTSVLTNTVEALIAALYIDGGLSVAQDFIHNYWGKSIEELEELPKDSKAMIQEWTQKRGLPLPTYNEVGRLGPDHAPMYELEVLLSTGDKATGVGKTKKIAEKAAAENLWKILNNHKTYK